MRSPTSRWGWGAALSPDRKSTRLNSSHGYTSHAVFCLKIIVGKVGALAPAVLFGGLAALLYLLAQNILHASIIQFAHAVYLGVLYGRSGHADSGLTQFI